MRILGISGSLRAGSFNTRLLRAAADLVPGAELAIWDGLRAVPPFDEDDERDHAPAPVHALREAIAHADVILIATPEYNASLPGQLKNALDWASRPYATNVLRGKPVAVIAASPTRGGAAAALADARRILARIGALVIDHELAISGVHERFDAAGELSDQGVRRGLIDVLTAAIDVDTAAGRGRRLIQFVQWVTIPTE
jgi:chromate reductase, NAD(P)H dehydrogenase (quinone)